MLYATENNNSIISIVLRCKGRVAGKMGSPGPPPRIDRASIEDKALKRPPSLLCSMSCRYDCIGCDHLHIAYSQVDRTFMMTPKDKSPMGACSSLNR